MLFAAIFITIGPVVAMLQAGHGRPAGAAAAPEPGRQRAAMAARLFLADRHPVGISRQCAELSGVLRACRHPSGLDDPAPMA